MSGELASQDSGAPTETKKQQPVWIRLIELLVTLAVLAFVVRYLWIQMVQLDRSQITFKLGRFALSLGLLSAASVLMGLVMSGYYRALGHATGWRKGYALATVPRLARYIPGKVATALGQAWLGHRLLHIPARVSVSVVVLMSVQGIPVSLVTVALLAPFSGLELVWVIGLAGLGLISVAGLHPSLCLRPIAWLLARLKRSPLQGRVSYGAVLRLSLIALFQRLISAGTFVLLVSALFPVPPGSEAYLGLAFVGATLLGFLAFFTPGGIGVQEGALALSLTVVLPAEQAALLAVAVRIWMTMAMLIAAALGGLLLLGGRDTAGLKPPPPAAPGGA